MHWARACERGSLGEKNPSSRHHHLNHLRLRLPRNDERTLFERPKPVTRRPSAFGKDEEATPCLQSCPGVAQTLGVASSGPATRNRNKAGPSHVATDERNPEQPILDDKSEAQLWLEGHHGDQRVQPASMVAHDDVAPSRLNLFKPVDGDFDAAREGEELHHQLLPPLKIGEDVPSEERSNHQGGGDERDEDAQKNGGTHEIAQNNVKAAFEAKSVGLNV